MAPQKSQAGRDREPRYLWNHEKVSKSGRALSGSWWQTPLLYLRARLQEREDQVFLVLALVIGALTGLTVVAFILLTERAGMRLYPPGGAISLVSVERLMTPIKPCRSVTRLVRNSPARIRFKASLTVSSPRSDAGAGRMTRITCRSRRRWRISAFGKWMPSCTARAS